VRGQAFENQDTPFQELMWGDYFRTFMSRRLIELQFDLAANLAMKLARLSLAEKGGFLSLSHERSRKIIAA